MSRSARVAPWCFLVRTYSEAPANMDRTAQDRLLFWEQGVKDTFVDSVPQGGDDAFVEEISGFRPRPLRSDYCDRQEAAVRASNARKP